MRVIPQSKTIRLATVAVVAFASGMTVDRGLAKAAQTVNVGAIARNNTAIIFLQQAFLNIYELGVKGRKLDSGIIDQIAKDVLEAASSIDSAAK